MLCYIDLEHDVVLRDRQRHAAHLAMRMQEKLRFEELAGMPCLVLRYPLIEAGWVDRLKPAAILISGAHTDWSVYGSGALDTLRDLIQQWDGPMIGFCAGHQIIAHAFGAPIGPLRPLRPTEPDPRPDYGPGLFKELGPTEIRVIQAGDPLFAGLPAQLKMEEDHYWEVKELPAGFQHLAMTEECRIQAFRHCDRLIYGTQFHPERYSGEYPEGRRLLQNFFRLVLR